MDQLQLLIRLFTEAELTLSVRVAELEARGALASAAERERSRKEAHRILNALKARALAGPLSPASRVIQEAYREGASTAMASLGKGRAVSLGGRDARALVQLSGNLANALEDGVAYAGRRIDDAFRRAALEELVRSQAQSRTTRASASAIADNLKRQNIGAFRDVRGREWKLGNYAKMAARTTQREAVSHGTLNRLAENGIDLVKVTVSPHACKTCQQHSGAVYSITGESGGYPTLVAIPPFHPNCTCVITAFIPGLNPGGP